MVECTALEMRHTRKGIGGSNPSLSASLVTRTLISHMNFAKSQRWLKEWSAYVRAIQTHLHASWQPAGTGHERTYQK